MQKDIASHLKDISKRFPKKYAIISDNERITYSELYEKASRFGFFFQNRLFGNKIVCVIYNRSIDFYACVLAIVLAGGSYLLYEPEDINDIIIQRIKGIHPCLILSERKYQELGDVILLKDIADGKSKMNIENKRDSEDILYVVNTSGTTGESKTVFVRDRNFMCYLNGYIKAIEVTDCDAVLQQSPVFYDGFAEEFFSMLAVGGTIVYASTSSLKIPHKIVEQVNKHKITILPSTPLMIEEINHLKKRIAVKKIVSSGDILKAEQIDWLLEQCMVYNMYGLTETTVCATYYKCSKHEEGNIPIGKPIDGYEILLLNEKGEMIGNNVQGEIYIIGDGVVDTIFRTGDYAWRDDNGNYHYVTRCDRSVKIRGNRVNLGQIENIIMKMNGVCDVAVAYKDNIMFCFFVSDTITKDQLIQNCKTSIPSYMKPNFYIKISKMPISTTGKIDYQRLINDYCMKKSEDELAEWDMISKEIVKIVSDITKCNDIKQDMNWEEIGVDSLSYIMIIVAIEEKYMVELGDDLLIQDNEMTFRGFCDKVKIVLERRN